MSTACPNTVAGWPRERPAGAGPSQEPKPRPRAIAGRGAGAAFCGPLMRLRPLRPEKSLARRRAR